MRVALVCPYDLDVWGGVQSHVRHLADELEQLGDEVVVVAPGEGGGRVQGVGSTVRVPFNDSVAPITLSPGAVVRTRRILEQTRPDIVHVHEPAVPVVSLAATLSATAPTVGTFHAWSDRDRAYKLARPLARRAAERLASRIAVSPAAQRYHAGALGLAEGRFEVVPNGVDVSRFADAEPFAEVVRDRSLLFVGRLEARKGLQALVRSFAKLKVDHPDLSLLVVGEGPERERCQAMLPGRLRADVSFLGHVEDDDLPRFYRSCDLFVSPAVGGESFGIVLLEAMAAGTPVVASDIPGYRTVLTDGREGRLVPPGDDEALTEAVAALLDNDALRAAMAEQGRATVQEYDWPVVAARVREIYERVLAA